MHMTKRDVLAWVLIVPAFVVLVWPLLVWLDRKIKILSHWIVDWLLAEEYAAPARREDGPTGGRHCPCACCGHRKAAHENGVDGCVTDGCDCRGFSGHDAE